VSLLRDTNLQIIVVVVAFGVMSGGLIGPILPSMIDPLDATRETIGLVLSVYTLSAVIFTPLFGGLRIKSGGKRFWSQPSSFLVVQV
jgi:MFS family permease